VSAGAIVVPGYGGSIEQPIVREMTIRLTRVGITARPISFTRKKPTGDFSPEVDELRRARDQLKTDRIALVGRSFGGRVCTRLASVEPPDALVVLAHPIGKKERPRPEDEAALASVTCPTLIVQGEHDALGPLEVLRRVAKANTEIYILKGTGHNFGVRQAEGLDYATRWLVQTLGV
jgi:pimeloyl-ACP methyl ester carboxylesterase